MWFLKCKKVSRKLYLAGQNSKAVKLRNHNYKFIFFCFQFFGNINKKKHNKRKKNYFTSNYSTAKVSYTFSLYIYFQQCTKIKEKKKIIKCAGWGNRIQPMRRWNTPSL